jgi:hypothetical protein
VLSRLRSSDGQASVEYVGIVLLVAVLFGALLAVGGLAAEAARLPRLIAERLLCAVRLSSSCLDELERAYGDELAELLRTHAPDVRFEDGEFVSLPVDPRRCRERACADSSERGRISASFEGQRPVLFVHPIDCRDEPYPERAECAGEPAGSLYLQYWLYYPDSATSPFGRAGGYHTDDWESYQVRIDSEGVVGARASSHKGHQYGADALSDLGVELPAVFGSGSSWGPSQGYVWVSAGSHAGRASGGGYSRSIRAGDLRLIAVEPNLDRLGELAFAISAPWRKRVWSDPEAKGT